MSKKENNSNYKKKLIVLESVKKIVREEGWSKNVLKKLINNKLSSTDLVYLFPNGYLDLLKLALNEINNKLEDKIKKINIINFPLSKRIKKILSIRMKILDDDKIFYKKTFNHLILPQNSKLMKINLYKSIDTMWYLAGDNSTDFSFYTKRISLALIYVNALYVLFNRGVNEAEINIDKNLKKISKIPKIKDRFSFIKDNLPIFLKGLIN